MRDYPTSDHLNPFKHAARRLHRVDYTVVLATIMR